MEKIAEKIASLLKSEQSTEEEMELYQFGIEQILQILLNVITMMVIGILCNRVVECVVFYLSYTILRAYAGGYHADTRFRCYVFSSGLLACFLISMQFLKQHLSVAGILFIIAAFVIGILAPVENINKQLEHIEKVYFRRITWIILIGLTVLEGLTLGFKLRLLAACFSETVIWVSILLVAGKKKLKSYESVER